MSSGNTESTSNRRPVSWSVPLLAALLTAVLLAVTAAPAAAFTSWGTPTNVSATGGAAGDPQVAVSADGTAVTAVWTRSNGSNTIVQTASGTVSGGTVTWGTVTDLSATGGNGRYPQIALSADGTKATAIWYRTNGGGYDILQTASATVAGTTATWSAVSDLTSGTTYAYDQRLAMSADGTAAVAVWTLYDGSSDNIYAAAASVSGTSATWSTATNLSASDWNYYPQIAVSQNGTTATALWTRDTDGIVRTATATVSGGVATWGSTTALTAAGGYAYAERVDLSADGATAIASWERNTGNGTRFTVQSAVATISGNTATWGTTTNLSTVGDDSFSGQVALSADGTRATAMWSSYSGGNPPPAIQSASATITGGVATWGSITTLSGTGGSAYAPRMALSADGSVVTAVWTWYDGTNYLVQTAGATISGTTATWEIPTVLSAGGANAFGATTDLSADGTTAVATWYRFDGTQNVVQSSAAPASSAKNFGKVRDKATDSQNRNREAVSGTSPAGKKK